MDFKLISSPLQGFTDYRFRNTFNKHFGGIDLFYAPYIRLNGEGIIKPSNIRDLQIKNNTDINLVPQIMTNKADEFLKVAQFVQELGYTELNWNLGCPYPMVTKRGLGSGLIKNGTDIDELLTKVSAESDINISIKTRLGYENTNELLELLPTLNKHKLKSIAIHPRLGKQLYKGMVDLKAFESCLNATNHEIHYNGDITTVEGFRELQKTFPTIKTWLIGRSVIADPFLPTMIKQDNNSYPEDRMELFAAFHDELLEEYQKALSGEAHLVIKMQHFWEYFITAFSSKNKEYKKIKRAKGLKGYSAAVSSFLANER